MVSELCQRAEDWWRRLMGYKLPAQVVQGVNVVDGVSEVRIASGARRTQYLPITRRRFWELPQPSWPSWAVRSASAPA